MSGGWRYYLLLLASRSDSGLTHKNRRQQFVCRKLVLSNENLRVMCRVLVLLHCRADISFWSWVYTHHLEHTESSTNSDLEGWLVKWLKKVGWDVIFCLWGPVLHQVIIHCCEVRRETFQPREIVRYNLSIVVIIISACCGSTYTVLVQTQSKKMFPAPKS